MQHKNLLLKNYFEFFNLPLQYDINLVKLKKEFLSSQAKFHPDKYQDKVLATQISAYANDAYKTLKNPALRAIYWCKLYEFNTKTQAEMQILEDTMQWHEDIENGADINQVIAFAQKKYDEYYAKFNQASLENNENLLSKYAQSLLMLDRFIFNIYAKN